MSKKPAKKAAAKKSTTKKPAKTGAKKIAKAPAKGARQASGAGASKASAKKRSAGAVQKLVGMHPISSGKGPSPAEIGAAVVAHLNSGAASDQPLWDKYWSKDCVSIEGGLSNNAWHGMRAIDEKCQWWLSENKVHGCRAEGPFVGTTTFAVVITMDVEVKASGQRMTMREVGVYTVQDGKVVREEFCYGG